MRYLTQLPQIQPDGSAGWQVPGGLIEVVKDNEAAVAHGIMVKDFHVHHHAGNLADINTYRGRAAHVLLTVEDYQRISEQDKSIVELLAMPAAEEVEFDPPRI